MAYLPSTLRTVQAELEASRWKIFAKPAWVVSRNSVASKISLYTLSFVEMGMILSNWTSANALVVKLAESGFLPRKTESGLKGMGIGFGNPWRKARIVELSRGAGTKSEMSASRIESGTV
jgi:hypothetical protein